MLTETLFGAPPLVAGSTVASPLTLSIQDDAGGMLSALNGGLQVVIPAGSFGGTSTTVEIVPAQASEMFDFLTTTSPLAPPGYAFGSLAFRMSVLDDLGSPIPAFLQPATVVLTPPSDDLGSVGDDLSGLELAYWDADQNAWVVLPTVINDDGTVSAQLSQPGLVALVRQLAGAASEIPPLP
jgi:hypothetical protein